MEERQYKATMRQRPSVGAAGVSWAGPRAVLPAAPADAALPAQLPLLHDVRGHRAELAHDDGAAEDGLSWDVGTRHYWPIYTRITQHL